MSDRGICETCRKPAIRAGSAWVCPNCGTERPYDPDRYIKKRVKPSGGYVWRK